MTNGQSVKKKQTVNKKQKLTIIICASVFAVLLVVYLAVIRPLLKTATAETKPPELLEGEVLGANNRVLMFPHTEKADILSIEVHNEKGTYKFYRGFNGDNDNFYIEGMEGAPYSLELLSSLVVSSASAASEKPPSASAAVSTASGVKAPTERASTMARKTASRVLNKNVFFMVRNLLLNKFAVYFAIQIVVYYQKLVKKVLC